MVDIYILSNYYIIILIMIDSPSDHGGVEVAMFNST